MVYPPLIKKSYPGARTIGPNGTCVPGITFCTAPIFPFDADFDPSDVEGPPDPFDPATEKGPVFPDPPAIDPVKGFPDLPAFPVDSPVFDSYLKAFWISKISYPSDRSCVLPVRYSKKDWIFFDTLPWRQSKRRLRSAPFNWIRGSGTPPFQPLRTRIARLQNFLKPEKKLTSTYASS